MTEPNPRWHEVSTTDPDEGRHWFSQAYADSSVDLFGDREHFLFRRREVSGGRFSLARVRYTMGVHGRYEPLREQELLVCRVFSGRRSAWFGRDEFSPATGQSFLHPPDLPCRAVLHDLDSEIIRFRLDDVASYAAAMTGPELGPLRFFELGSVSAAMERHWRASVEHVSRSVLANPTVATNRIILGQAFRKLASALLAAFPNTTTDRHLVGGHDVSAAALRRVGEHLDGHAHEDVTPADVAEAAGSTPARLAQAFQGHRRSAAEHLRRARLDGAHRDLRAADPTSGDTVDAIAARWGFADPRGFTARYRATYGRPPERTLND